MRRKLLYVAALAVSALAGFLFALLSHFPTAHGNVDVSGSVIIASAIVVGPIGGTLCGLSAGLAYFIFDAAQTAAFEVAAYAITGLACGILYKYVFRGTDVRLRKFVAAGVTIAVCFAARLVFSLIVVPDAAEAIATAVAGTLVFFVCALTVSFILPKVPHYFDEAKFEEDIDGNGRRKSKETTRRSAKARRKKVKKTK